MFTLWLDHGAAPASAPSGGSYVYAIWPDAPAPAFTAGGWRADVERYQVWNNTEDVQAVYDTAANALFATVYAGNATALTLPSQLLAGSVTPPFPCGLSISLYLNTTNSTEIADPTPISGGPTTVLRVSFAAPGFLVTEGRGSNYYFVTAASFVPCSWPNCPGAVNQPKGYNGTQFLKWDCFGNGTVHVVSPPSQLSLPPGLAATWNCAFLSQ